MEIRAMIRDSLRRWVLLKSFS